MIRTIRKTRLLFTIVIMVSIFLCNQSKANDAEPSMLTLNSSFERLIPGKYLDILEDKEGTLAVDDLLGTAYNDKFIRSGENYPSPGYTESVYWARFQIKNTSDKKIEWYLEFSYPLVDDVQLFVVNRGNVIDKKVGGDKYPFYDREIDYKNVVFPVEQKAKSLYTIYIRMESRSYVSFNLIVHSKKSFIRNRNLVQISMGFFSGAIIIMILYTFFLWLSVRDASYLWYVFYYLSFLIFQLCINGVAYQYLWPESMWWNSASIPFLVTLSVLLALVFAWTFLNIKKHVPLFHYIMAVTAVIMILFLPLSLLLDYQLSIKVALFLSLLVIINIIVSSIVVLIQGYRPARFFIMAWGLYLLASAVNVFRYFSFVPDNMLTIWGQQGSSLVEMVLLSFALADKINYMKRELQTLNVNLEKIVMERTKEIQLALEEMKEKDYVLQQELELAGHIQQGILPQRSFYHEGIKIDTYYRSMGKVGGDFFDIFQMMGGNIGVLIADASGHGVPAAFITALAKISFSDAIQRYLVPRDIFVHVNDELVKLIKTDDFVTAFFIVINPNYEISYCNASHNKALIYRKSKNSIIPLDSNGLFMGALPVANEMYENKSDRLFFGDRMLLYTDGITESVNRDNKIFGEERLRALLLETGHLSLEDAKDEIIRQWEDYREGKNQIDDVAFVLIELDQSYKDVLELRNEGLKLQNEGLYSKSIEVFHRALNINANDAKTHLLLGDSYLKYGRYYNSIDHFERYLSSNNEVDADAWYKLSCAYYYLEKYESAASCAEKAVLLRKQFVDALIIWGLSHKNLGDIDRAADIWIKVLLIDPENIVAKEGMIEFIDNV